MGGNIGKQIRQKFCYKYNQKLLDYANQSAGNPLNTTSKRAI